MTLAEELTRDWRSRLQTDCSDQSATTQDAIIQWLVGEDVERFDGLAPTQLAVAQQAMDYRYRILRQRYLGVHPERGYTQLIQRLSSLFLIRSKIKTWVALSRDRQRTVTDVLKEVIQELIQSDSYIRQQMRWIAQCTANRRLINALLLATIEEYCLRPIRNQPLLVYRFVNHLRRTSRGGMTQVPTGELVRLVSEEITPDEADNPVNLLDNQAVTRYQDEQAFAEQQGLRTTVKDEFIDYLNEKISPEAGEWLTLHLQGKSQEAIAQVLNMPIKQVYRLREKISYHAVNVFASKHPKAPLVTTWLGTSLQEHSLGLTPDQWSQFLTRCTPTQQHLIDQMKAGKPVEAIAQELNMKANQIVGEWSKLYLAAQELRNAP
jgi:hypothetical protein